MKYWIQYHNYDHLGYLPGSDDYPNLKNLDGFNTQEFDGWGISTNKKVKNTILGDTAFLIVGIGSNPKKYYLWSRFIIDEIIEKKDYTNLAGMVGLILNPPVKLNEFSGFREFFKFCGSFGLGFQNITNQPFTQTLLNISNDLSLEHDNILSSIKKDLEISKVGKNEIKNEINKIDALMKKIQPEKFSKLALVTDRKDKKIVNLLKVSKDFACQFPKCGRKIKTKEGKYYIEVAHITPVSEGGKSVLSNLLVLCPNHHKEFDYGELNIIFRDDVKIIGDLNGENFEIYF